MRGCLAGLLLLVWCALLIVCAIARLPGWLALVIPLAALTGGWMWFLQQDPLAQDNRRRLARLTRVAALLGDGLRSRRVVAFAITGNYDSFGLTVEESAARRQRIVLEGDILLPALESAGLACPAEDVRVALPARRVIARGVSPALIHAVCDAGTWELLPTLVEVRLEAGRLVAEASADAPEELAQAIRGTAQFAERLRHTNPRAVGWLAAHAASVQEPVEKLRCLQLLLRDFPDHPRTREAWMQAEADGWEGVLQAAVRLGIQDARVISAAARVGGNWTRAAAALGLRLAPTGPHPPFPPAGSSIPFRMEGEIGGLPVAVGALPWSAVEAWESPPCGIRVCVPGLDARVAIAPNRSQSRMAGGLGGGDVRCGDDAFDTRVRLSGDPIQLLAAFDADARRAARTLVADDRGRLERGELTFRVELRDGDEQELIAPVRMLVGLAERLRRAEQHPAELLAEKAGSEPEPGARLEGLRTLIRHFPEGEAAAGAAAYAVEHAWCREAIELGCAHLGAAAVPLLERLVASAAAPEECRGEARLRLGKSGRVERERAAGRLSPAAVDTAGGTLTVLPEAGGLVLAPETGAPPAVAGGAAATADAARAQGLRRPEAAG